MKIYQYLVKVKAEDHDAADKVLTERLDHDEEIEGVGYYEIFNDWTCLCPMDGDGEPT